MPFYKKSIRNFILAPVIMLYVMTRIREHTKFFYGNLKLFGCSSILLIPKLLKEKE
ncbi:hypothetical protein bcgnr5406_60250 [Bacillus cereus]